MKRRDFLKSIVAGIPVGAALGSAAAATADVTAEIEEVLARTADIWASQDTAALRALWDTDDPEPYYLAAEQDNWFVGWPAINSYLAPESGPKVFEAIRVRYYDVSARLLAPDLAYAACWARTDMKLVFQPKPFGSDNRVSAVFRRKTDGWRYLCYAEGFQSPPIYMQKLYEKNVSPDYQEFFDRVTGAAG